VGWFERRHRLGCGGRLLPNPFTANSLRSLMCGALRQDRFPLPFFCLPSSPPSLPSASACLPFPPHALPVPGPLALLLLRVGYVGARAPLVTWCTWCRTSHSGTPRLPSPQCPLRHSTLNVLVSGALQHLDLDPAALVPAPTQSPLFARPIHLLSAPHFRVPPSSLSLPLPSPSSPARTLLEPC
jgi:hypothetical protein